MQTEVGGAPLAAVEIFELTHQIRIFTQTILRGKAQTEVVGIVGVSGEAPAISHIRIKPDARLARDESRACAEPALRAADLKIQIVPLADILDANAQEAVGPVLLGNVDIEVRDPVTILAAVENVNRRLRLYAA